MFKRKQPIVTNISVNVDPAEFGTAITEMVEHSVKSHLSLVFLNAAADLVGDDETDSSCCGDCSDEPCWYEEGEEDYTWDDIEEPTESHFIEPHTDPVGFMGAIIQTHRLNLTLSFDQAAEAREHLYAIERLLADAQVADTARLAA